MQGTRDKGDSGMGFELYFKEHTLPTRSSQKALARYRDGRTGETGRLPLELGNEAGEAVEAVEAGGEVKRGVRGFEEGIEFEVEGWFGLVEAAIEVTPGIGIGIPPPMGVGG